MFQCDPDGGASHQAEKKKKLRNMALLAAIYHTNLNYLKYGAFDQNITEDIAKYSNPLFILFSFISFIFLFYFFSAECA